MENLNPEFPELEYPKDFPDDLGLASQQEAELATLCAESGMTLAEYRAYMATREVC